MSFASWVTEPKPGSEESCAFAAYLGQKASLLCDATPWWQWRRRRRLQAAFNRYLIIWRKGRREVLVDGGWCRPRFPWSAEAPEDVMRLKYANQ